MPVLLVGLPRRSPAPLPAVRVPVETDHGPAGVGVDVIRIGSSTSGHHGPGPMVPTARDALLQTTDRAVAAEEAAQTDLISDGRLHLGVSSGSPEPALDGPAAFGYDPPAGDGQAELAHDHTEGFLHAISGAGIAEGDPATGAHDLPPVQPRSPGPADRVVRGSATRATARWTAERGTDLMSSTPLTEDTGIPFDELQAEQIDVHRKAWAEAGHARRPQVAVSRSVLPIVSDLDERCSGRSFAGEPDVVAAMLLADAAVRGRTCW